MYIIIGILCAVAVVLLIAGLLVVVHRRKKQIKYEITKDMKYTESIYYTFIKYWPYTLIFCSLIIISTAIRILLLN
ncbi:hypothetical protein C4M98_03105 [Mycoplasmopsis pullorum]|nr:hypothetical protein C4M94_03490 [Mycoplasmopsis pullorum]TNK83085.1 hypothetical protein C4M80_01485 [Mycoplasmopsis pullorum]TNK85016.1 hypothetical protein C4M81_00625 [Mycoplasmopsis pullorum]TNK85596.1 hypothetical protein C4M92_00765 [Mycoplasmopsis pullorum]TNK86377.1 hypothetical protein C4M85_00225 [Mycoplasmopsis pullorum]